MTAAQAVQLILGLLAATVLLAVLAHRLRIPYPILFVLGGLALGLVPGIPHLMLAPDLVLLLFLPPTLYSAGIFMSPRAVRVYLRPIVLLAVGLVVVTTVVVALVAHLAIEDLSWTTAFLLGAIISPTNTAVILAVAERLRAPPRAVVVLEGENLFNDAAALVLYRTAVVAAVTGTFPVQTVAIDLVAVAFSGVAIGIGIAWLVTWIRSQVSDPLAGVTISLLSPLTAWIPADLVGVSAALAVVAAGMYVGQERFERLPPAARVREPLSGRCSPSCWRVSCSF